MALMQIRCLPVEWSLSLVAIGEIAFCQKNKEKSLLFGHRHVVATPHDLDLTHGAIPRRVSKVRSRRLAAPS